MHVQGQHSFGSLAYILYAPSMVKGSTQQISISKPYAICIGFSKVPRLATLKVVWMNEDKDRLASKLRVLRMQCEKTYHQLKG